MWPHENPWPLIFVLGMLATGCFVAWYQRGQGKYLMGIFAAFLLAGLVWYGEKVWVTPRERVEADILAITAAFQQGNLEQTQKFISSQAQDLRRLVQAGLMVADVQDDMRVSDISVEMLSQNTRAKSRFRVNATVKLKANTEFVQYQPTRWEAKWQLEGGEWKMIDIFELDPITGERLDRVDHLRDFLRFQGSAIFSGQQ
ncbi:MAG: hypothetical protein KDA80_19215 [Planctomycetaceae bacterium]|nr:hypothetical protein [Planctomycetaceae bacterium]